MISYTGRYGNISPEQKFSHGSMWVSSHRIQSDHFRVDIVYPKFIAQELGTLRFDKAAQFGWLPTPAPPEPEDPEKHGEDEKPEQG